MSIRTTTGAPNGSATLPAALVTSAKMTGKNIGDLLNTKGLTWGWFQGGFTPSSYNGSQPVCATVARQHRWRHGR